SMGETARRSAVADDAGTRITPQGSRDVDQGEQPKVTLRIVRRNDITRFYVWPSSAVYAVRSQPILDRVCFALTDAADFRHWVDACTSSCIGSGHPHDESLRDQPQCSDHFRHAQSLH